MQNSIISQIPQYVNLYFINFLGQNLILCIHTKFSIFLKQFLFDIFGDLFILPRNYVNFW